MNGYDYLDEPHRRPRTVKTVPKLVGIARLIAEARELQAAKIGAIESTKARARAWALGAPAWKVERVAAVPDHEDAVALAVSILRAVKAPLPTRTDDETCIRSATKAAFGFSGASWLELDDFLKAVLASVREVWKEVAAELDHEQAKTSEKK